MTEDSIRIRPAAEGDIDFVASLSAIEFGAETGFRHQALDEVESWRWRKSPTLAAKIDGEFAGFARCKPNEVQDPPHPRIEGQVAVLVQVAVLPEFRGLGVGSALIARATKTLRMLGFSKVVAQFQPALAGWYEAQGWTVLPVNHGHVWIEPHIQRDDDWYPDLPARAFSPVLRMSHLARYPQQAFLSLGDDEPIVLAEYDAGLHGQFELIASEHALGEAIVADDHAWDRIPDALMEAILASPIASPILRRAAERRKQ